MPDPATILIVDDAPDIVVTLGRMLRGYQLRAATSGPDALEWLQHNRTDLILLDMNMPDMSGIEVLGQLRGRPETERVPVILVTADVSDATRSRALTAGASDVIQKPVDPDTLLERVARQLAPPPASDGAGAPSATPAHIADALEALACEPLSPAGHRHLATLRQAFGATAASSRPDHDLVPDPAPIPPRR